jgi:HPt (histidine-containing phosphotransfer) domain-containing protein
MQEHALVTRFGGDWELARQLVALFVEQWPAMRQDLRDTVAEGNADGVRRAAHSFKGAVANFTDGPAVEAARALEQAGRATALAAAPVILVRLEREVEHLLEDMRAVA